MQNKRVRVLFLVHSLSFFSLREDTFGRNDLEVIHHCFRMISKATRDLRDVPQRTKRQGAQVEYEWRNKWLVLVCTFIAHKCSHKVFKRGLNTTPTLRAEFL